MKLLSFILSLYIFSLVTAPAFGMLDLLPETLCCQDFCSTENEQKQHNDQDNDGCTEICNPFLSCQCGFGFTSPYINNSLKPFSPFKAKNREYKQSFSFQYFHTIWHPPKA